MKKIITILCILLLAGCSSVEEPSPEVYDAVARTCIEQGKTMFVYKSGHLKIECRDP